MGRLPSVINAGTLHSSAVVPDCRVASEDSNPTANTTELIGLTLGNAVILRAGASNSSSVIFNSTLQDQLLGSSTAELASHVSAVLVRRLDVRYRLDTFGSLRDSDYLLICSGGVSSCGCY